MCRAKIEDEKLLGRFVVAWKRNLSTVVWPDASWSSISAGSSRDWCVRNSRGRGRKIEQRPKTGKKNVWRLIHARLSPPRSVQSVSAAAAIIVASIEGNGFLKYKIFALGVSVYKMQKFKNM